MTIGTRAAVLVTIVATVAIGFTTFALRSTVHAHLSAYTSDFAMMRSMMGSGPNLLQIYADIDRIFITALLFAVVLAVIAGITLGRMLGRSFRTVNGGLTLFAKGRLDEPIRESGPLELRLLARNANTMASQLAASRGAERELVAGVVHDLAHPITALRATIDALHDGLLDVRDASVTQRMLEAVVTLEATTEDLRDVAEWQTGAMNLHRTDVDLPRLVRRVDAVYGDYAARRGVSLRIASEPATVHSDLQRLQRLLDNLIVNAIQATPAGGTVSIAASSQSHVATLTVTDEAGESAAARLRAALEHGEGTGLGLRVVRAMAGALGAQLTVNSNDAGSTVKVTLDLIMHRPKVMST